MSHEIRTPLNGITGMTELVLATGLTGKQRTYLAGIKDSATSLAAIINDVLDFSKIEAGKLELVDQPFDLAQVLDSTLASFRLQAEGKGLALASAINPGVPTKLVGDPVRLRQILVNLVGNAVKFTDKGSIDIQVGMLEPPVGPARGQQVRLLFSVRDTGIGIPLEDQGAIFDMFAQGDAGTTKRYAGTGLGLSITRNLVELMRGTIWVVSKQGEGSTFYFTVLLAEQGVLAARAEAREAEPAEAGPLRILVAEDNAINRMLAEDLLRQEGHAVTSVEDGQAALEALEREPFDVVLMDVSMPRLDGIEATRRIRASASGRLDPAIPVIALTAHAFKEDEERVLAAGMDGYIAKPVAMAELNRALSRIRRKA
jgi:CheY-like chemotaxis protein